MMQGQRNIKLNHIILSSVTCVDLPYFSTFSQKVTIFWEESYWTQNVCCNFSWSYRLKYFLFWEELSEILSYKYIGLHTKYPIFLSSFGEYSPQVFEKYPNIKFPVNLLVGTKLYNAEGGRMEGQADRQTYTTKLIVAFRRFAKASKSWHVYRYYSLLH